MLKLITGAPKALAVKVVKKAAVYLIRKEGDVLQTELVNRIHEEGPATIDKVFDAWQAKLEQGLLALPAAVRKVPVLGGYLGLFADSAAEKAVKAVQYHGDLLQEQAKKALHAGGIPALNRLVDEAQDALIIRIEAFQVK